MKTDSVSSDISRRTMLMGAAATSALLAISPGRLAGEAVGVAREKLKLSLFSKLFQWTDIAETAAIAKEIGFDALDLTVRPKGHVLPERVATDLPRAVETVRKAGLEVSMISTEIKSVTSPYADAMLKTASGLGIRHYRWGGLVYRDDVGIAEQIRALKPQVKALEGMNRGYGMCGMYHTHSGPKMIGGPIWDLWVLLQDLDPQWIGMNYDIGHATVEGGYGGWETSARLARDSMKGIALKDFRWPAKVTPQAGLTGGAGKRRGVDPEPEWCAIGDGIVDFRGFFEIVKGNRFSGPVQMHFEYPEFGGAENGETTLRIPKERLIAAVRRDFDRIKRVLTGLELA